MQYLGYLRRDPNATPDTDYSGYNFWLNKLTQFNGDYIAAEMVKAFISSTEYRQRFGPFIREALDGDSRSPQPNQIKSGHRINCQL
jgi:hypothetical protein